MRIFSAKSIYLGLILILIFSTALISCSNSIAAPTTTTQSTAATSTTTTKATTATTVTPVYGGVLKSAIVNWGEAFGYSPTVGASSQGGEVCYPCLEAIVAQDSKGNFKPTALTTDLKFDADKKTYTLTLRKGVKFHDGTVFDAKAAKWNLDAIKAGKNIAACNAWDSIDVIDDYTIRITMNAAGVNDMNNLAQFGGFMCSPTAVEKNGVDWAKTHPVGTGPFQFKSYIPGTSISYVRFDDYWGGKPYLDEFDIIYMPDSTTGSMALQAGDIDMLQLSSGSPSAHELVEKGYKHADFLNMTQTYVPDSKNPSSPLADKNVRLAINYSLNKPALVTALGFGLFDPADQICPKAFGGYVPGLNVPTYNVDKAKQLLAAAGYGTTGLKTQIIAPPSANPTHLTAIQQNLKDAGITCEINIMTQAGFNQAESQGWTNGILSQAIPWSYIFAYTLQRMYATTSTFNKSLLRPAGFDDLIIQANSTTDTAKSLALCQQISTIMQNEALIIPTWNSPQMRFTTANVHDTGWYRDGYSNFDWTPGKTWKSK